MKNYLFLFMLFFQFNLTAQVELKKVMFKDEYSWRTHTQEELNEFYFGLQPLLDSNFKFHFRYSKEGQVIDIFSNDGKLFRGRIVNHIREYKKVKKEYGDDLDMCNYVFDVKKLDSALSSEIGKYLVQEKIYELPTDSLITNWDFNRLHCSRTIFRSKMDSEIYSASFGCYQSQEDSIEYIHQIRELNRQFIEILRLDSHYSTFKKKLEKGKTYSSDGYMLQYRLTDKQQRNWNKGKQRRAYLEVISDTITNYLEKELNDLIPNPDELDCFDEYYLVFSKRGDFKKLKVNTRLRKRIFDKDYQKCKRVIIKAIRQIKIDFVNPQYSFIRTVSLYEDKLEVYDSTVY